MRPVDDLSIPQLVDLLSPRETETLSMLLHELSEQAIGEQLGLSTQTVYVYVKNLYRTFRVTDKGRLLTQFMSPAMISYVDARRAALRAG